VQRALYLVFNEGYHGASSEAAVRETLCREALYLTRTLLEHPAAAVPTTYALLALMCLTAARLPSRLDADGGLVSLRDQDRSRWNRMLIEEGRHLLDESATGEELSEYHLEAAIAAIHASAPSARETRFPFELEAGRVNEAKAYFEQARALSRNPSERRFFEQRLACLPGRA
jgi:RNA polymerase sigma-70 factor (ECF subfamily)